MDNPWINMNLNGDSIIAECDRDVINKFKYKDVLKLDFWPEVFIGNPNASVYLLNGNPGFADIDSDWCKNGGYAKYKQVIIDTFCHTTDRFFYFDNMK